MTESAPEPVVGNLTVAKNAEDHAAQFDVARVITDPGVEVGTASIASAGECLKTPVALSRRNTVRILSSRSRMFHCFRREMPHHLQPTGTAALQWDWPSPFRECHLPSF